MNTAVNFALEEAGRFENAEMLGDGGKGEGKWLSELCDGGFALREAGENGAAGGIGECREGGVEGFRGIVNHMVYYCRDGFRCQENFLRFAFRVFFWERAFFRRGCGVGVNSGDRCFCGKERRYAAAAG